MISFYLMYWMLKYIHRHNAEQNSTTRYNKMHTANTLLNFLENKGSKEAALNPSVYELKIDGWCWMDPNKSYFLFSCVHVHTQNGSPFVRKFAQHFSWMFGLFVQFILCIDTNRTMRKKTETRECYLWLWLLCTHIYSCVVVLSVKKWNWIEIENRRYTE